MPKTIKKVSEAAITRLNFVAKLVDIVNFFPLPLGMLPEHAQVKNLVFV